MKQLVFSLILLITNISLSQEGVGINTNTPDQSAILDISSTNSGLLIPRMTQSQRTLIASPAEGLLVYQTDASEGFWYYNGTSWALIGQEGGWTLSGNSGTNPTTNKIGTVDPQDFVVRSNNNEVMRFTTTQNVGVGTTTPTTQLHVSSMSTITGDIEINLPLLNSLDQVSFEEVNPISGNISSPNFPTSPFFEFPFTVSTANPHTGSNAVVSAEPTNPMAESILALSTTLPNTPTVFEFWTDIQGPATLRYTINGFGAVSFNGPTSGYQRFQVPIGAGFAGGNPNVIELTSIKDGTTTFQQVYIDDIRFFEIGPPPPNSSIKIIDGNQATGRVLTSGANGDAVWNTFTPTTGIDNDWNFSSGATDTDPLFHQGNVVIGTTTQSANTLHISNGSDVGSSWRTGSIEVLVDDIGTNGFLGFYAFKPNNSTTINAGSPTRRWTEIWATNGTVSTSDVRTKERIENLTYGLNEVLQLRPVSFKWKEEKIGDFTVPKENKTTHLGFIAQELEKVIPEVVQTHYWDRDKNEQLIKKKKSRLSVNYSEIIPVLVSSIQEQEIILQKLESQNRLLREAVEKRQNN